jgi:D-alanyl-D-alanine dipeptidase
MKESLHMIVTNRKGLTASELKKVTAPYAHNTGKPVDLTLAGKAAVEFLKEHPDLLSRTGALLDTSQQ